MIIRDQIIQDYISGRTLDNYREYWIYKCFGRQSIFETPDSKHVEWVTKLYKKILEQLNTFTPRNSAKVNTLFPNFADVASNYTIMLVVGFPDPYDAMVLEHQGKQYMVFDLIQFGEDSLNEGYSCHRVLTHELIHMCLSEYFPAPKNPTYFENLDYTAFNEGFAHALSYPESLSDFVFDDFFEEKFMNAKKILFQAISETDFERRSNFLKTADTGEYWDKYAAISGKLFLLKNKNRLTEIFKDGWHGFAKKILEI